MTGLGHCSPVVLIIKDQISPFLLAAIMSFVAKTSMGAGFWKSVAELEN